MEKGIKINGRPYNAGAYCEVVHAVPRSASAEADAPRFYSVVKIHSFYVVACGSGLDRSEEVFISVEDVEVVGKYRSLYVRQRPADGAPEPPTRIIHVDGVVRKIHFVPHFSQDDMECGVPVWDAK